MNTTAKLSRVAAAVALTVGLTTAAMAQETSSAIRGAITGPTGNPAPNTVVTVKHIPTGAVKTITTNSSGQFSLDGLRVGGPYEITLDSDVFEDTQINDVYLTLGEPLALNYALEVESDIEVIQISASSMSVSQFGKMGPSASFDLGDLAAAPSINRNITDIIRIDPRVYVDETRGDSNPVQCVGKSNRFNSLTVDGVKMNDSFGLGSNGYPTVRMPFSFDAIDQVTVEIAPFDVIFSGFTGCNINAVTKSGTNEVHGGVFYDFGSDSLQGDSLEGDDITAPSYTDKRYGVNVGFPILKDKLFGFVSYEKYEGSSLFTRGVQGSGAINESELTQAELDDIIRISNDLYQYDPGPVPTSEPEEDEKLLIKLDWNINDDHRLSYTYNYNDGFFINTSDGDLDEFELRNHLYEVGAELNSHALSIYSDWTDKFSTEVRYSYLELDNRQLSFENRTGEVGGQTFGEMRIAVGDTDVYIGGDDSRSANDLNYDVTGIILRGYYSTDNGHDIKFGYEREALDVFNVFVQHVETEIRFNSIADFEAGLPSRVEYNNAPSGDPNDAAAVWSYETHAAYIEDEFSLTDDLIIKAGIRYDWYTSNSRPVENEEFTADYGFSNTANLDGKGLVQPRIGFNYYVDDSTELHGGIGLFSGGNPNVWLSNNFSNNNVLQFGVRGRSYGYTDGSRTLFDDDIVWRAVEDGAPAGPGYGIPSELYDAVAAGDGSNFEINYLDPDFDIPSEVKLALGLTHQTENDYFLQADILISRTDNAAMVLRGDLEQVGTNEDGYAIYDSVRMGSFVLTNSDVSSTSYTVSFGVTKFWDNGINLIAGYAYNNAEDVQPMTSSVAFSNYQFRAFTNPNEQVSSLSDYNIEHRLTASLSYEVELWGGYPTTFGAFALIQSGRPFSYTLSRRESQQTFNFTPFLDSNNVLPPGGVRNGEDGSWWNKVDLRITQQIPAFSQDHSASAFIVFDNFTNFLNDDWGIAERVNFNTVQVGDTTPEARIGDASLWEVRVGFNYNF